jgi:hypothetical protein
MLALPGQAVAQTTDTTTVEWTAPGDDGNSGTATTYQLRYRTTAISGTDTLSWWNAATTVPNLPAPRVAGSTESMVVRGLNRTLTYYFILRTADEVPNWSGFSNIAIKLPSADGTPPAAITDLAVPTQAASQPARVGSNTPPR